MGLSEVARVASFQGQDVGHKFTEGVLEGEYGPSALFGHGVEVWEGSGSGDRKKGASVLKYYILSLQRGETSSIL
jgi:hypothetical protein